MKGNVNNLDEIIMQIESLKAKLHLKIDSLYLGYKELFRNEAIMKGEEGRFKLIGQKVLTHEDYENLIQDLIEDDELIKEITSRCDDKRSRAARCLIFKDETIDNEESVADIESFSYAGYTLLIRL